MSIRIATTIEAGKLKLEKVHRCDQCPNVAELLYRETERAPGQRKAMVCELRQEELSGQWIDSIDPDCPLPTLLSVSGRRSVDLDLAGRPLALLERYMFTEGEVVVSVARGSNSTMIHFSRRVEAEDHPDEVLIWLPTGMIKDLKAAL